MQIAFVSRANGIRLEMHTASHDQSLSRLIFRCQLADQPRGLFHQYRVMLLGKQINCRVDQIPHGSAGPQRTAITGTDIFVQKEKEIAATLQG